MNAKFAVALAFALVSVAVASTTLDGTKAVSQLVGKDMSANPLTTFQGGCSACVGNFPGTVYCLFPLTSLPLRVHEVHRAGLSHLVNFRMIPLRFSPLSLHSLAALARASPQEIPLLRM